MSLFGVADAIGTVTRSVGEAIATDLKNAVQVAGMGGSFQVDLEVLYRYYGELLELHGRIDTAITSLSGSAVSPGRSRIAGVAAAEAAHVEGFSGNESLSNALRAIQGELARHLQNLHDSYTAYIKADETGSQRLTAAANPEAAASTKRSGKQSGW